jgi:predicted phosphodiesterase
MKPTWILTRRQFLKASGGAALLLTSGGCSPKPAKGKGLRVGLVSDTHYADRDPMGTRYYRESISKFQECVDKMNEAQVDFMVHIGDFKDEDAEPTEARTLQYVRDLETVYAQFSGPRYHVLGNHDIDSISKEQFLGLVENTGIDSSASYYSFDNGGFHFVVLDATFRQDGVAYDKGNFDWKDTFIPSNQLDWLKADLGVTKKPTVVFVHQLLDSGQTVEHQVKNAAEVRQVLEHSNKVLAVFHGHQHSGGYHQINGIHYYTLTAVVEQSGLENNSYAILEIGESGDLMLKGYRRVSDMEMAKLG